MTSKPITHDKLTAAHITLTHLQTSHVNVLHATLSNTKRLNALSRISFNALNYIVDLAISLQPCYLLISSSARVFSAGGDVVAVQKVLTSTTMSPAVRIEESMEILVTEYKFMERLAALDRNVVTISFADGKAIGAGAGLFTLCDVRLVTESAALSMPEGKIGLVPDCAVSRIYASLPGGTGMYLAMTGAMLSAADMVELGVADAGASDVQSFLDALSAVQHVSIEEAMRVARASQVEMAVGKESICSADGLFRRGVDDCFLRMSFDEIVDAVKTHAEMNEAWAVGAMRAMNSAAPRASRKVFKMMREAYEARDETVAEALARETKYMTELIAAYEFQEGVRALLIDKDGAPQWKS